MLHAVSESWCCMVVLHGLGPVMHVRLMYTAGGVAVCRDKGMDPCRCGREACVGSVQGFKVTRRSRECSTACPVLIMRSKYLVILKCMPSCTTLYGLVASQYDHTTPTAHACHVTDS